MLYCGSYSYLKEKLLETVKAVQKNNIKEKLTFIVHTNQMRTYLKEYLAEKLGILINSEFYTLIDISKKITKIEPLQDFDKELIIKKFLYEKGLKLDGIAEDIGLLIQQLKEFEIPVNNLKESTVKEIINSYQSFLKKNDFYDREDVHKIAINSLNENLGTVFVFGLKSVPSLHQKLFKSIKKHSNNFYVFSPVFSDSGVYQEYLHLKEVRDFWEGLTNLYEDEGTNNANVALAKEIINFNYASKEIKNEDIKIIKAKNEQEEVEYVAESISNLLLQGEKPHNIGVVVPQISHYLPFIKEVFKKHSIPYYLVEESRFIDEILFKKLFNIFKIKENNFSKDSVLNTLSDELLDIEDIEKLEELIILSSINEGFNEWSEVLDKNSSIFKLLSEINLIKDEDTLDNYIQNFSKIKDNFIKSKKAKNFLENIFQTIKKSDIYKKLFEKVSYEEFVSILEQFFNEENKENKIKGNTVRVLTPISAEGNNFKYIYFLNLNSGDFPSNLSEEIFATAKELNGLDYPFHLLMQEVLNFTNLLDKDKKITLSFVSSSLFVGEKPHSFLIEEIARILDLEEINLVNVSNENSLKDFYVKYAKYLKNVDENLKNKWEKLEKLMSISKEDFKFDNVEIQFPVSATGFSTYAYCPYKFYLDNIIGIEEIEEPDRTVISPAEKGTIIHSLLEQLYKKYPFENLKEELEEFKNEFEKEIKEKLKMILPSFRPFEENKALKLLDRTIRFIYFDIQRLKKESKKPEILEKSYKNEYFSGKIDRVDMDSQNNFYIYDYKTGKSPENLEEEIKNKYIQLVIYKDFLENEGKNIKELGIIALNDETGKFIYSINDEVQINQLTTHLKNLLKQLEEKYFYPLENDLCIYCQYQDFCLKDKFTEEK